jgi:hypothetical protein
LRSSEFSVARSPSIFKQRDVTLALKGAKAAGMRVARYEIDRLGTIRVFASNENADQSLLSEKSNEWDTIV